MVISEQPGDIIQEQANHRPTDHSSGFKLSQAAGGGFLFAAPPLHQRLFRLPLDRNRFQAAASHQRRRPRPFNPDREQGCWLFLSSFPCPVCRPARPPASEAKPRSWGRPGSGTTTTTIPHQPTYPTTQAFNMRSNMYNATACLTPPPPPFRFSSTATAREMGARRSPV